MSTNWFGWLRPQERAAHRALQQADAARDRREWARAVEHYAAYASFRPNDWGIRVQLGHVLKESHRLSDAEAAYRAAAEAMRDDADVRLHLGEVLKALGRAGDAAAVFAECISVLDRAPPSPEHSAIRAAVEGAARRLGRDLGDLARDAGHWSQAIQNYQMYLEVESSDGAIWVQLGNVAKEARQFGLAEAAYRRAAEIDASQPEPALQLGHLLKLLDRRDEAREAYRRATEFGGGAEALREFTALAAWGGGGAGTAMLQGGVDTRVDILPPKTERVAEKPKDPIGESLRVLLDAQAARDRRSWDVACSLYGPYLAHQPADAEIWLEYATVLRKSGRYQQAYEAALRAEAGAPNPTAVKREQVLLLRHLGRHSQAEVLLSRLMVQDGPAATDLAIEGSVGA